MGEHKEHKEWLWSGAGECQMGLKQPIRRASLNKENTRKMILELISICNLIVHTHCLYLNH